MQTYIAKNVPCVYTQNYVCTSSVLDPVVTHTTLDVLDYAGNTFDLYRTDLYGCVANAALLLMTGEVQSKYLHHRQLQQTIQ